MTEMGAITEERHSGISEGSTVLELLLVGLSHHTTPVEVREKLAFSSMSLDGAIKGVHKLPQVREALLLSTCNRVEALFTSEYPEAALKQVKEFIVGYHGLSLDKVEKYFYTHAGREAVRHLFRVTSSLDSMVVGEAQILGQVKDAYRQACSVNSCGVVLNRLMHKAFSVAKRIRTETAVGASAVSVSYVAVELGKKIFSDLAGKSILLIGAGEMAELSALHLARNGARPIIVANRTFSRGQELAAKFGGRAVPFSELLEHLKEVDIVISSTGSPQHLVSRADMQKVIKARRNRPLFLIDIAVPRDMDPAMNEIDNVYLYDIDDLEQVTAANLSERKQEATRAEQIVEEEADQFLAWLKTLEVTPTVVSLITKLHRIREEELNKALSEVKGESESLRKALEVLSSGIINKILHQPVTKLKREAGKPDAITLVDAARRLFDLDDDEGKED